MNSMNLSKHLFSGTIRNCMDDLKCFLKVKTRCLPLVVSLIPILIPILNVSIMFILSGSLDVFYMGLPRLASLGNV